jgi:hypothetical protein
VGSTFIAVQVALVTASAARGSEQGECTMAWLKLAWEIIKAGAKYGAKFANWVWANKKTILKWSSAGYTVAEIVLMIARALGMA